MASHRSEVLSLPVPGITPEAFHGQIGRPGLIDLLASMRDLALTGMLRIHSSGHGSAEIHLDGGRIRYAAFGDHAGTAALTRAIMLDQARFELVPAINRPARNIHQETDFVLASIARVLADAGIQAPSALRPSRKPTAAALPPATGQVLGRCRLVTEFARGANSLIFLGWHETLRLDVVVKVLLPGESGAPDHLALTANEAHVLARLSHPAIMRIYDFDGGGAYPYLVMEYVDGRSLASLLKERVRLDARTAIPLFAQVADGLAFAAETAGVIHCDIKPDNLLVDRTGRVRIADFGLAGVPGAGPDSLHAQLARQGKVIGTPTYIAPELVEGGVARADQRSDIYSLGATLYHALCGRPPFADPDPIQLMVKRLRELPPHPRSLAAAVDQTLGDLAMRMLAPDPSARPQNHREVVEALADIEDGLARDVVRRRGSFWANFRGDAAG